ncbi:DUF1816 domain-containing protein [cyanobacterium endosymbiont of Epithemia turgida]|uniref:DUF1816 domain-containing protein n=1 Tax=cyanobacterium endosymbiont of Epithemia turgida TaxID=718217 RepID=UPI001E60497E|nr:DUF1816 domain-containing protein [cyanobacterium endosymbiont of Epithemia turgida]
MVFRKKSVRTSCEGYIKDLQFEGVQEIKVIVKRCSPSNLTIFKGKYPTILRDVSFQSSVLLSCFNSLLQSLLIFRWGL